MVDDKLITDVTGEPVGVQVESLTWDSGDIKPTQEELNLISFELTMRGSAAALLSAGVEIDNISVLPMARLGSNGNGQMSDKACVDRHLSNANRIHIAVVDFRGVTISDDFAGSEGAMSAQDLLLAHVEKLVVALALAGCGWWVYSTMTDEGTIAKATEPKRADLAVENIDEIQTAEDDPGKPNFSRTRDLAREINNRFAQKSRPQEVMAWLSRHPDRACRSQRRNPPVCL